MRTNARAVLYPLLLLVVVAGAGCGSSPPVRYFTLASDTARAPAAATATDRAYVVTVGPVTVPEVVDRPHLVLRTSSTRVEVAENARWAAPLKSEIPRVIAVELARLLPGASTVTSSERAAGAPEYRVLIDVQRFDSTPGESATIEASWSVRARDGASSNGRTVASERAGAGYDDLVAAHSRALGAVAKEIAGAVARLRGGG